MNSDQEPFFKKLIGRAENLQGLNQTVSLSAETGQRAILAYLNLHALYLIQKHAWFGIFLQNATTVYCDGEAVRWAAKLWGQRVPDKIGLTRWVWDLADLCEKKQFSLFLLGGRPGVGDEAGRNLRKRYPNLKIAGVQDGYFDHQGDANEAVIERMKRLDPDVVLVAFGMPAQEAWIQTNLRRFTKGVFIPGGGVLDYAAGRLGKAPRWMIRCHMEWLFRVYQEPGRLFKRYLVEIPWFVWFVLREKIKPSCP